MRVQTTNHSTKGTCYDFKINSKKCGPSRELRDKTYLWTHLGHFLKDSTSLAGYQIIPIDVNIHLQKNLTFLIKIQLTKSDQQGTKSISPGFILDLINLLGLGGVTGGKKIMYKCKNHNSMSTEYCYCSSEIVFSKKIAMYLYKNNVYVFLYGNRFYLQKYKRLFVLCFYHQATRAFLARSKGDLIQRWSRIQYLFLIWNATKGLNYFCYLCPLYCIAKDFKAN